MSSPFSRSIRSLERDRFGPSTVALLIAALILVLWLVWFFLASTAEEIVSRSARLEQDEAARAIQAPATGLVALSRLTVGEQVAAGDVLLALDTTALQAALDGERARGSAQTADGRLAIARLEQEIEARRLHAPVGGRIIEAVARPPGSSVKEGEALGTLLPAGKLIVIAGFDPAGALGRVAPGQSARLTLTGFPSTIYGTLPARVERVAGEARDGEVRVELSLLPERDSRIPLQFGLQGEAAVEIDRVSPATLVMRSAGQLIAPAGPR